MEVEKMDDGSMSKRSFDSATGNKENQAPQQAHKKPCLDQGQLNESPEVPAMENNKTAPKKSEAAVERERIRLEKQRQREEEKARREAEKARREAEKEEKRRAKEEEKRRKEEEREQQRRLKEEEKKRKEEEKKRKEEERENERKRKEEEKKRKEEEKRKKEEAEAAKQPKIANFFTVKSKKSEPKADEQEKKDEASTKSEFDSTFLQFHIKPNCILYPQTSVESVTDDGDMSNWLKSQQVERGYSIRSTARDVVDMMTLGQATEDEILSALNSLPRKHLQFYEDVRPPYVGTFCKPRCWFATTPCERAVDTLNYDYDSEAEWVQDDGEDGEDLDINDESEDALDDEDDDMDEFVAADDELSRRSIIGPLVPVIKWNDGTDDLFNNLRMEYLCDIDGPIDPFKDYWSTGVQKSTTASPNNKKRKLIPEDGMKQVLERIKGQDMNQNLLVEILKRDFPKYSKEMIRNTLKEAARRVGEKEPNKRWEITEEFSKQYNL